MVVAWHDARNDSPTGRWRSSPPARPTAASPSRPTSRLSQPSAEFNNSGTISTSDENTTDNPNFNPNQYGEYIGLDVKNQQGLRGAGPTRGTSSPASRPTRQKENVAVDTRTLVKLGILKTLKSIAIDDGYVLEQSELASAGGSNNSTLATTSAIRAGDSSTDQEYRGILSFITLDIPEAVTIVSVRLRLKRGAVIGTSPYSTHGNLTVDVNTAGFSGNLALENSDWEATATATNVCTLPEPLANGDWTECFFNAAGILAIHKNGRTQVRVHFTTGDNDDAGADYMGFYSGNSANDADKPEAPS